MRKTVVALCLLFAAESAQAIPNAWLPRRAPACSTGAVTARCKCGTAVVRSGYCCSGVAQAAACQLFDEDAGTVAHIWFNGTALQDTKGNAWTMAGTVPQVAASGQTPAGAGPFSAANYYVTAATNDVFDTLTSGFTVCVAFADNGSGAHRLLTTCPTAQTAGWSVYSNGLGAAVIGQWPAGASATTSNTTATGLNVVCWGRTAAALTAGKMRLNLGTTASGVMGTSVDTTVASRIGIFTSGIQFWRGTIYEILVTTTDWSDANAAALMNQAKSRAGVSAW